ncbi:MAG: type II toxin-antitoxin system RelE/ParE family toxin [Actinomycetes bacterium]
MESANFALLVMPPALRGLDRLGESTAAAVVEFLLGDVSNAPRGVGRPLRRDLDGLWSARRGPYRVVYEIDDAAQLVVIVRIDHRADVYRPR